MSHTSPRTCLSYRTFLVFLFSSGTRIMDVLLPARSKIKDQFFSRMAIYKLLQRSARRVFSSSYVTFLDRQKDEKKIQQNEKEVCAFGVQFSTWREIILYFWSRQRNVYLFHCQIWHPNCMEHILHIDFEIWINMEYFNLSFNIKSINIYKCIIDKKKCRGEKKERRNDFLDRF